MNSGEVASRYVPDRLLPQPLPRCPLTWQSQWWWLEYQIDLAAATLQEEVYQMARQARKFMELEWAAQDHIRHCLGMGLYCIHQDCGAKRRANGPDHAKA